MNSSRRFAQLDSLRAFAVAIVMLHHFMDRPFFLSGFGAALFLVLSAYFATKTLLKLRTQADLGRINGISGLKSFYLQRSLRLFPLYYLTLGLTLLCGVEYAHASFMWNAAFLSNFRVLFTGEWIGRFSPLWSLSLLEQFYLIWPGVILFTPKHRLLPVAVVTILVAPIYRLVCLRMDLGPIAWAVAPFASMDQLGSGALLAICGSSLVKENFSRRLMAFAGYVCVPLFMGLLACKALHYSPPGCAIYINLVASLAFIWLVKKAELGFEGNARIVMENRFLGHIGRISYSIFLLHTFSELLVPKFAFLQPLMHSNLRALVLIPISLLLAHFSYSLIEYPIQCFRKRYLSDAGEQSTRLPLPSSVFAG